MSTKVILVLVAALALHSFVHAGPLTPPAGAVAPTSGPDKRIALNLTNTPGDANSLLRISQPGSYYLEGNITGVASKAGIEVAASNVTIDLNGFTLQGVATAQAGVRVEPGGFGGLTICNGAISGWGAMGVDAVSGRAVRLRDLTARFNTGNGLGTGNGAVIELCFVESNTGAGIFADDGGVITRCTAQNNNVGISAPSRAVITHCAARSNAAAGINAGFESVISECLSCTNQIGISTSSTARISQCTVTENTSNGITAGFNSLITANNSSLNGSAGILVTQSRCVISDNNLTANGVGVSVAGTRCIIIRNAAAQNSTNNYQIGATNYYGPIVNRVGFATGAASGNTAASTIGTTDPYANFAY